MERQRGRGREERREKREERREKREEKREKRKEWDVMCRVLGPSGKREGTVGTGLWWCMVMVRDLMVRDLVVMLWCWP